MILLWMLYSLLLSLLLAAAAWLTERAVQGVRFPTRALWIAAIVGVLAWPPAGLLSPRLGPPEETAVEEEATRPASSAPAPLDETRPAPGRMSAEVAGSLTGSLPVERWARTLRPWDRWAVGGWGVWTLLLAGGRFRAHLRLRHHRRRWSEDTLTGREVLLSADQGPAVVGFFRSAIVLPRWIVDAEQETLRAVLAHEEEHLARGDHRWLTFASLAVVAVPWNPVLRWCVRRLRHAVETDCDRRVLDRGVEPEGYARLLLEVGEQIGGRTPAAPSPAALVESSSFLERRIRKIVEGARRKGPLDLTATAAASVALLGTACEVPSPPVDILPPPEATVASEHPTRPPSRPAHRPIPVGGWHELEVLKRHYPPQLRRSGREAAPLLRVCVGADGTVGDVTELSARPSSPAVREAALRTVRAWRWIPALAYPEGRRPAVPVPACRNISVWFTPQQFDKSRNEPRFRHLGLDYVVDGRRVPRDDPRLDRLAPSAIDTLWFAPAADLEGRYGLEFGDVGERGTVAIETKAGRGP